MDIKKKLWILLFLAVIGLVIFSFVITYEPTSKNYKEYEDIKATLGEVANDYLNADLTKIDAIEKVDILEQRYAEIEEELISECENADNALMRNTDVTFFSHEFLNFKSNIEDGEVSDIKEIKRKYYNK